MSLERVIKTLQSLDLTNAEAEVYVYIAQNGPQTVVELDIALNYSKNQIYKSLKTLKVKTLIKKNETIYSALPFEKALELLIEQKKEKVKHMNENKKKLFVKRVNK